MTACDSVYMTIVEPIAVIISYEVSGWVWRRLFPRKRR